MAEYIDSNTLSKLRAISILEVADELGMGLRYHNALCISHNDTNPSLHFWTSTNTCHCFVCGWGGDNIDLVMKRENLSFSEACQWLCRRFNISAGNHSAGNRKEVLHRDKAVAGHRKSECDTDRLNLRGEFQHKPDVDYLMRMLMGKKLTDKAKDFLFYQRKLRPEYIYWCRVVSTDFSIAGYRFGGKFFDGPSLLIPYYDVHGNLLTVQSRYLGDKTEEKPRFKFAPGSKPMVYGMQILPQVTEKEPLVITEGCTDCWSAMSMGYKAIAIPSATLCNEECRNLLAGRNLHMWPDQDKPGIGLYMKLKEMFPQLVYHQLPEGCKDLSDYYQSFYVQKM